MEELIFSLITCFLHRRFFPEGRGVTGGFPSLQKDARKARDRLRPFGSGQRE